MNEERHPTLERGAPPPERQKTGQESYEAVPSRSTAYPKKRGRKEQERRRPRQPKGIGQG